MASLRELAGRWATAAITVLAAAAALVPAFTGIGSMYPPLDSRWPVAVVATLATALPLVALIWWAERRSKVVRESLRGTIVSCVIVTLCLSVAAGNWVPWVNGRFDASPSEVELVVPAKVSELDGGRNARQAVHVALPGGERACQIHPRWLSVPAGRHIAVVKPGYLGIRWLAHLE